MNHAHLLTFFVFTKRDAEVFEIQTLLNLSHDRK